MSCLHKTKYEFQLSKALHFGFFIEVSVLKVVPASFINICNKEIFYLAFHYENL
jgi:hypothetical protein